MGLPLLTANAREKRILAGLACALVRFVLVTLSNNDFPDAVVSNETTMQEMCERIDKTCISSGWRHVILVYCFTDGF